MQFTETTEFAKEFKKLRKKYKTLDADITLLKSIIKDSPMGGGMKHWNRLHDGESFKIFKLRMMCRAVKGKKFRVIYAYHNDTNTIELVDFIEIYFKGDKESEDMERIRVYIENITGSVE